MASTRERNTPWPAEPRAQASPPAVVCALNGSPPGRAAAAYAAALARALGWSLGLVASGLRPLELPMLAEAVVDEGAGIVVQPSERRGTAAEAGELATRAAVPVVVVPRRGYDQEALGRLIVAVAAGEATRVGGVSTRLALGLGATLRFVHTSDPLEAARLVEQAEEQSPGLVVMAAEQAATVHNRRVGVPVMFVPSAEGVS